MDNKEWLKLSFVYLKPCGFCRYNRNLPVDQNFSFAHFNIQKMGTPFYDIGFSGCSQNPNAPASFNLGPHSVMSPYVTTGSNQPSRDATMYMQWPNAAAVMYTHSYEHFRNAPFQVTKFLPFFTPFFSLFVLIV